MGLGAMFSWLGPLLLLLRPAASETPEQLVGPEGTEGYFWYKRAGTYVGHGAVPWKVPTDLSKPPAWTWDNPDDELYRHGPVIDGEKNIYVLTSKGLLRKFNADGKLLWTWSTSWEEGVSTTSPFLYKGKIYLGTMGVPVNGQVGVLTSLICLDMQTGKPLFKAKGLRVPGGVQNMDSVTVHVAEDIVLQTLMGPEVRGAGNNVVYAMNASDGAHLWNYHNEGILWNFMPSTPGDGTFYYASTCGVAQRRRLKDGSMIWKSELEEPLAFCGTGGGTLGPNGIFYAEGNWNQGQNPKSLGRPLPDVPPCSLAMGCPEGKGILVAHNAEDGKILWARRIKQEFGGWQYPTVGRIDGRLALIAGVGENPNIPNIVWGEQWMPIQVRIYMGKALRWSRVLRRLYGIAVKRNGVAAYDAQTGKEIWFFEETPWDQHAALGDEEPVLDRYFKGQGRDHRHEIICGPDNWGIPAVTGDGVVLMGSGCTGYLYAIKDRNADGVIQASEVSSLETQAGFLNGPALAPGMLAVTPCWGKMYVFKN